MRGLKFSNKFLYKCLIYLLSLGFWEKGKFKRILEIIRQNIPASVNFVFKCFDHNFNLSPRFLGSFCITFVKLVSVSIYECKFSFAIAHFVFDANTRIFRKLFNRCKDAMSARDE